MELTFLGGADEVGASCTLVRMGGKVILVDAGIRISPKTSRGIGADQLPDLSLIGQAGRAGLRPGHPCPYRPHRRPGPGAGAVPPRAGAGHRPDGGPDAHPPGRCPAHHAIEAGVRGRAAHLRRGGLEPAHGGLPASGVAPGGAPGRWAAGDLPCRRPHPGRRLAGAGGRGRRAGAVGRRFAGRQPGRGGRPTAADKGRRPGAGEHLRRQAPRHAGLRGAAAGGAGDGRGGAGRQGAHPGLCPGPGTGGAAGVAGVSGPARRAGVRRWHGAGRMPGLPPLSGLAAARHRPRSRRGGPLLPPQHPAYRHRQHAPADCRQRGAGGGRGFQRHAHRRRLGGLCQGLGRRRAERHLPHRLPGRGSARAASSRT